MPRLEMTDIDQRIARVCDPATARRYEVVYHNPNTGERWLVARVLPGEVSRFVEALQAQGCERVIHAQEGHEWCAANWLRRYEPTAPIDDITLRLRALRAH